MKQLFSIIVIIVLCLGKINSQTATPTNLSLSGTKTGNNEYEALNNIQSTQIINSGKTTYTAGNEIVLNPGFETKPGSEFEAKIDDVSSYLTIMTYNIYRQDYHENGKLIKSSGADVVAVQEILRIPFLGNFTRLKEKAGMDGKYLKIKGLGQNTSFGIALLWNTSAVGSPIRTVAETVNTSSDDPDGKRGYIIAEFHDFIFVSTHLSGDTIRDKAKIIKEFLKEDIIKNSNKPVFIGGDFNFQPNDDILGPFLNTVGFEVLNNLEGSRGFDNKGNYRWIYTDLTTDDSQRMIDLICGEKNSSKYEVLSKCIPDAANPPFKYSDHRPYMVKVKLK